MRRATVYSGAVPLETDLLNTNKNTMISIGHVLQDMLGTSTLFSGLACVPTGPAGMTVNVNPGRAYSLQSVDTGAYSSLSADAHQIVKQGISLDVVNFACPAPGTAGFSINYLIQGAFQEVDAGSTVLPYYNASNPATAYSGPNNTGTSNTTYRDNTVQLQLKAGTAATTGSQVTPTPDAGFNGLWVVTVAFGAVTITSGNITQYAGAPFLTNNLLSQIQAVPTTGRLLNIQTFTASGTYTPTAGTTKCKVTLVGGGGSGGGAGTTTAGQVAYAGGGGGGGLAIGYFSVASLTGQTVTVGAGGAAASSGGNTGGTSSIGAVITATGGGGGAVAVGVSPPAIAAGGSGGTATGANISGGLGGPGGAGIAIAVSNAVSGGGGASALSQGVIGRASTTGSGNSGSGPGCGGSGAAGQNSSSAQASGAGANGIVIIEEFA